MYDLSWTGERIEMKKENQAPSTDMRAWSIENSKRSLHAGKCIKKQANFYLADVKERKELQFLLKYIQIRAISLSDLPFHQKLSITIINFARGDFIIITFSKLGKT